MERAFAVQVNLMAARFPSTPHVGPRNRVAIRAKGISVRLGPFFGRRSSAISVFLGLTQTSAKNIFGRIELSTPVSCIQGGHPVFSARVMLGPSAPTPVLVDQPKVVGAESVAPQQEFRLDVPPEPLLPRGPIIPDSAVTVSNEPPADCLPRIANPFTQFQWRY